MQSETKGGGMETIRFYFPLFRGFVWRSGKLADLPPLPGCDESRALGVNDGGWAVGSCRRTENYGQSRATLWQGGKPLALDTLVFLRGWKLAEALAINSHGQILCTARDTKGNSRSVLLTPTRG